MPNNTVPREATIEEDNVRVQSYALFSNCETERYRYFLSRTWNEANPVLMFIMLNPSTATEREHDPTVTLCRRRAMVDNFGALWVLNLFAHRATNSSELRRADCIGPCNDTIINQKVRLMTPQDKIVYAWGSNRYINGQDIAVRTVVNRALRGINVPICRLGLTPRTRKPEHPLYPLIGNLHKAFVPWVEPEPEVQDAG